ncbi:MAG: hypothetical protein WC322_06715 [Candidatus Paceibacterota bacterium]|jgi:hypothetical protein
MTKDEVLMDTASFQRACSAYVNRNIVCCVSNLIYELQAVADQLDDYDTYLTLTQGQIDYESAVHEFIMGADVDLLEEIADSWGSFSDVVNMTQDSFVAAGNELMQLYTHTFYDEEYDGDGEQEELATSEDVAVAAFRRDHPGYPIISIVVEDDVLELCDRNPKFLEALREAVWHGTSDYVEVFNTYGLDSDDAYNEIYEHWVVDRYFAKQLKDAGEVVEDYMGLTIWGRTTTGQSICMDYVVQEIVRNLSPDNWVWAEA